jgi:hypothetical protein
MSTDIKTPVVDDYGYPQKRLHNMSSIKVEEVEAALNMDENNYEAFSDSTLTMQKMQKNT